MSRAFSHVVFFAVQGLGVGRHQFNGPQHRRGNATLAHLVNYVGGLSLPTLGWLGLGNAAHGGGLAIVSPPAASWGIVEPEPDNGVSQGHLDGLQSAIRGAGLSAVLAGADLNPSAAPAALLGRVSHALEGSSAGLVLASFDPAGGHGPSPVTMGRRLVDLDAALGDWLDRLGQDRDVLFILASACGRDPVLHAASAPGGEPSALLAFSPAVASGVSLGPIGGLGDVAATAAEALGVHYGAGRSFLSAVLG